MKEKRLSHEEPVKWHFKEKTSWQAEQYDWINPIKYISGIDIQYQNL